MVGKLDYSSVPTSADLENNSNQKKYTVNRSSDNSLVISRSLCALMAIGALLLAILVGLVVFFVVPRGCSTGVERPQALQKYVEDSSSQIKDAEDTEEVDERLPSDVKPVRYRIQIRPYFDNSSTQGSETITLVAAEDASSITIHVNNIKIDKHSVKLQPANGTDLNPIEITSQEYLEGQRYRLTLAEKLKKGSYYDLSLNFSGEINGQLQGFYKSHYVSHTKQTRTAASTQFSPTDARRAFPCFDEPSFKANFSISVARPFSMNTLSNMPVKESEVLQTSDGQWLWDHYPETPKMPTYLVAFIISDLAKLQSSDPLIRLWARKDHLSNAAYAAAVAPGVLRYFERYFKIPFPLPKIDIVAVPEFGFSAMENWGLITFRESSLLFDPQSSTVEDQTTIATVLSHEIAHQWFGNLVTPKWWNDLWLKEGFSTYLQYLGVNHAEPSWKLLEEFLPSEIARAMSADALESSRPISFEVVNSRQIKQAFDEISYAKGACIIRMMNHFLGEDAFKNGLTKFLEKYKYSNADRNDLFESLSEEAHLRGVLLQNETVKDVMDTWTEQAGFPVLYAIPDYGKNTLTLVQKRFLLSDSKTDTSKWWIPVSYTSSVNPDFMDTKPKLWLRDETTTEVVDPIGEWYLLNINYTGYYIVNYDEKNWKTLSSNIMSLPPLIRAQLISDAMDLARANQLDYSIPLTMIARMATQDKMVMFVPTSVAFEKLKYLSDILYSTPAFGLFEEYHKAIFKATYNLVEFNDDIEDYLTRRIRQAVLEWSCRSPESFCVHKSRLGFREWMIDGKMISPNLRPIAYCTAIRAGSEIEWEFAYNKYMETTSPTEKNVLLDALGCTKQKWLLSRYIEKLIDPNVDQHYSIRIQDADRVFESVAKNKEGTNIAFDFIRKNWNDLLTRYGDGFNILGKMIKSLAVHMNTEFQLAELERFRDSIKQNISTTTNAFDSAIETVKANVDWLKKNYQQVEDWLKKYQNQYGYF